MHDRCIVQWKYVRYDNDVDDIATVNASESEDFKLETRHGESLLKDIIPIDANIAVGKLNFVVDDPTKLPATPENNAWF
jgi:hypothetical protein